MAPELHILRADRDIAVCVKPVGTLSEEPGMPALLREQLGGGAWCVHRLDRAVGGVMVYARTQTAAAKPVVIGSGRGGEGPLSHG